MNRLWIFIFLVFLILGCTDAENNEDIRKVKERAETSDKLAQYVLGKLYDEGEEINQDYKQAMHWYKLSAGQGLPEAQFALGRLYDEGLGGKRNAQEAEQWYLKAAQQGHARAQYRLGVIYEQSQKPNYTQALNWYNKAAALGNASAQYNLGIMHLQGKGTTQNPFFAYIWFNLATQLKHPKAAKARDEVATSMTVNELENANQQTERLLQQLKDNAVVQ